jgi:hypothetical protein
VARRSQHSSSASHSDSHECALASRCVALLCHEGAGTGRIRATGIARSGVPAGTTATPAPAGCPLSAGCRPRTGPRPPAGIPRPAGRHRRGGSDLAPDHFSICCTRCAARSPRSGPSPYGQAQSRSKIELTDVVADTDACAGHDRLAEPSAEETLLRAAALRGLLVALLILRRLAVLVGRWVVRGPRRRRWCGGGHVTVFPARAAMSDAVCSACC